MTAPNGPQEFGSSIEISGDTILVGLPGSGRVFVYDRDQGGAGNWGRVKILKSTDSEFGHTMAIKGNTIALGGDLWGLASLSNAVHVFRQNKGGADNWGDVQGLIPSDAATVTSFDVHVATNGETTVANGFPDRSVYIFTELLSIAATKVSRDEGAIVENSRIAGVNDPHQASNTLVVTVK